MVTLASWASVKRDMVPHIDTLQRLAADRQLVVEFGVRTGVSTWAMLDVMPRRGALRSWDIEEPYLPSRVKADDRWVFTLGDSLTATLPLGAIPELVFIDSSHEYHQTVGELALAAGWDAHVIALHDWNLPDVQDAVTGFVSRTRYRIEGIEPSEWGMVWLAR